MAGQHSTSNSIGTQPILKPSNNKPACHLCRKTFETQNSVIRHVRLKHGGDTTFLLRKRRKLFNCFHEECRRTKLQLKNMTEYRSHLERQHNVEGVSVANQLIFTSFEQAKAWKAEQERKDMSKFVVSRSIKSSQSSVMWQYECHRSGSYMSRGSGKRRVKSQGSCKSGYQCPAMMTIAKRGDLYHVTYYAVHYGHEKMLCHLRLTSQERRHIADQLAQGMSTDRILQNIRHSAGPEFTRSHLITRKDLNNIRQAYGIKRDPTDDVTAPVSASKVEEFDPGCREWVKKMANLGSDSPVIYYCQSPRESFDGMDLQGKKVDFQLILMNPLQRKLLQKFGQDRVCIDSTLGSSGLDFELTTVLVVDDYEEAFPVSFMCSSTADLNSLVTCFDCLKSSVGVVRPQCLLTDDIHVLSNAWATVMGAVEKRVAYTHVVDKLVRTEKSRSDSCAVANSDNRQAVQKALRTCYNDLRAIKQQYTRSSSQNNLQKCIDALFTLVLDKQFSRLTKLHKGMLSTKLASLLQSHTEGIPLAATCIQIDSCRWQIHSAMFRDRAYVVQRLDNHECSIACPVICRLCHACLSSMSCACDDYQIYGTMCKHIHAVSIALLMPTNSVAMNMEFKVDQVLSCEARDETQFYLSTLRARGEPDRFDEVHQLTREIDALTTNDNEVEDDVLRNVLIHLRAVKNLLRNRHECIKHSEGVNYFRITGSNGLIQNVLGANESKQKLVFLSPGATSSSGGKVSNVSCFVLPSNLTLQPEVNILQNVGCVSDTSVHNCTVRKSKRTNSECQKTLNKLEPGAAGVLLPVLTNSVPVNALSVPVVSSCSSSMTLSPAVSTTIDQTRSSSISFSLPSTGCCEPVSSICVAGSVLAMGTVSTNACNLQTNYESIISNEDKTLYNHPCTIVNALLDGPNCRGWDSQSFSKVPVNQQCQTVEFQGYAGEVAPAVTDSLLLLCPSVTMSSPQQSFTNCHSTQSFASSNCAVEQNVNNVNISSNTAINTKTASVYPSQLTDVNRSATSLCRSDTAARSCFSLGLKQAATPRNSGSDKLPMVVKKRPSRRLVELPSVTSDAGVYDSIVSDRSSLVLTKYSDFNKNVNSSDQQISSHVLEVDVVSMESSEPLNASPIVKLNENDLQVILQNKRLTIRHMDYGLALLRKQFHHIAGLESTQLSQSVRGFTPQKNSDRSVVQIHDANSGHWVTSTRASDKNLVIVFDSSLTHQQSITVSSSLQLQLAQVYHCINREIPVLFPETNCVTNPEDSGLFALARATDICCGQFSMDRMYDVTHLRSHVYECFKQERLKPFPAAAQGCESQLFLIHIPVFCICRLTKDNSMLQCSHCAESFHSKCIAYIGGSFTCASCCADSNAVQTL